MRRLGAFIIMFVCSISTVFGQSDFPKSSVDVDHSFVEANQTGCLHLIQRQTVKKFLSLDFNTFSLSNNLTGRLPMFCALEKKLSDASKVWIKIRLPEKTALYNQP